MTWKWTLCISRTNKRKINKVKSNFIILYRSGPNWLFLFLTDQSNQSHYIRSSYLLICFAWPLWTHSVDGILLSIWTRNKRHHRYSFVDSYLELHLEINSENETLRQKRGFRFPIVNFPFIICSNISAPHAYGVCYSRLLVPFWISVIEDCCL